MNGFVLLRADRTATLLADDPVVPATDVTSFTRAAELLAEAESLRREAGAARDTVLADARSEGFEAGRGAGVAAGEDEVRATLLRLAKDAGEREDALRADLARLALEVVRRIAADIGEPQAVAAIAARAAQSVLPEATATVRVHPDALAATRDRLAGARNIAVEADAALATTDCVIDTSLGRVHAGLETQLAQLARTWGIG